MTADRDELAKVLDEHTLSYWSSDEPDSTRCKCGWRGSGFDFHRADMMLAAGWRKLRAITTVEELSGMRDGTVIIGPDGLVGEKRDYPLDLAVRYVDGTTETNTDIPMPATVLYTPEESQ